MKKQIEKVEVGINEKLLDFYNSDSFKEKRKQFHEHPENITIRKFSKRKQTNFMDKKSFIATGGVYETDD